jgi:eukaryotic-like serine/threonine-protein kinase
MSPERWPQISEVLEQALELPAQARPAFLAEACGTDDELRAEVESLLGAHQAAGTAFLADDALAQQAAEILPTQPPDLSGQSIKQFELLRRIGLGGMGEVYLANDTALRRQVALKLLPSQASVEDERLRRFAREARAASSLNHPNIMTVHEFGQENGRHFIVTEYVEGQTLRERLEQAPLLLPLLLDEALAIADQVLAALGAAHDAGIVHRDIKPENLMVRTDGVVKVLDFGIAKLLPRAREDVGGRAAATRFLSTQQGMVLGTPGYMSPEQVRGYDVTSRSDLFSFGVVFYELLAGRLPFQGETNADFVAKVLTTEPPPLAELRPDLPPAYGELLKKLLDKDPAKRMETAQEVRQALARAPHQLLSKSAARLGKLRRAKRQLTLAIGLLLVLSVIGAGWWGWHKDKRESATLRAWSDISRIHYEDLYTNKLGRDLTTPAFSPDGQNVAFAMSEEGPSHLYLLPRQGGKPQQLTFGSAYDRMPVWSPDGQHLAFLSNRAGQGEWGIWKLPRMGGEPELLFKLSFQAAALLSWRDEAAGERLYFVVDQNLQVLNLRDLTTRPLTHLLPVEPERNSFSLSPEGNRLIYLEFKDQAARLNLLDLRDGSVVTLFTKENLLRAVQWFADGQHLVFISEVSGTLQPHLYSLAQGQAVPLNLGSDDFDNLAVALDGRTLLGQSKSENANIYAIDMQGQETVLTTEKGAHHLPVPSPDGQRLLFQASNGHLRSGGELIEKGLGAETLATHVRAASAMGAEWSPNGNWLAYVRNGLNQCALYLQDRSGKGERLVTAQLSAYWLQPLPYSLIFQSFTWTLDSRHLVYVVREGSSEQLWQVDLTGGPPRALSPPGLPTEHYWSPLCAPPQSERVAFIRQSSRAASPTNSISQLLLAENQQLVSLYETNSTLQMVGWLRTDEDLLVAEGKHSAIGKEQDATLLRCQVSTKQCLPVTLMKDVYLSSLQLSPDKATLAYVAQRKRSLNLYLFALGSGKTRSLTNNSDPGLFYAGLHWAYDNQRLFFSKQTSFEMLRLIELR